VTVPDMKHYERFLHEVLFSLPGVTHVRSSIVLREIKSEVALPLGHRTGAKAKSGAAPSRR
jgi:DNA-binding Lrp family transcriptional regulator